MQYLFFNYLLRTVRAISRLMACVCRLDALKPVGNLVAHRAFSVRFITTAVIVDHIILWLIGSSYTERNTHSLRCDLNFLLLMGIALTLRVLFSHIQTISEPCGAKCVCVCVCVPCLCHFKRGNGFVMCAHCNI